MRSKWYNSLASRHGNGRDVATTCREIRSQEEPRAAWGQEGEESEQVLWAQISAVLESRGSVVASVPMSIGHIITTF